MRATEVTVGVVLSKHGAAAIPRDARWIDNYNTERPHSWVGYATPTAFAAELEQQRAGLTPPVASPALTRNNTGGLWSPLDERRRSRPVVRATANRSPTASLSL